MMAAEKITPGLMAALPAVEGRYEAGADLSAMTWFRVGGPAEVLFQPAGRDDLARFLAARPAGLVVTVIGLGSNLLVRDGGVPGVVVRLGEPFAGVAGDGADVLAGAGASGLKVASFCREAGLAGLEFLSGIPGTLGGAVRMNAGAFGAEMADRVVSVEAVDGSGQVRTLTADELGFSYRRSAAPEDLIFTHVRLGAEPGRREEIEARLAEIRRVREEVQPMRTATGGSTFVNPPGKRAWELIERAGCRGLTRGGAAVSDKHANFLINTGNGTAADLEGLGEEIRRRVLEATGVILEWEIRRIGIPAAPRVRELGTREVDP